jgi:thioredoxin 1
MKAQEIKTGRVLVDFYADWCGPCRMLSKQLEQYEAEVTDVKVVKVNIEEEQEMSRAFGVRSIPAIFYMEDGNVIDQANGMKTVQQLKEFTKIN